MYAGDALQLAARGILLARLDWAARALACASQLQTIPPLLSLLQLTCPASNWQAPVHPVIRVLWLAAHLSLQLTLCDT